MWYEDSKSWMSWSVSGASWDVIYKEWSGVCVMDKFTLDFGNVGAMWRFEPAV